MGQGMIEKLSHSLPARHRFVTIPGHSGNRMIRHKQRIERLGSVVQQPAEMTFAASLTDPLHQLLSRASRRQLDRRSRHLPTIAVRSRSRGCLAVEFAQIEAGEHFDIKISGKSGPGEEQAIR